MELGLAFVGIDILVYGLSRPKRRSQIKWGKTLIPLSFCEERVCVKSVCGCVRFESCPKEEEEEDKQELKKISKVVRIKDLISGIILLLVSFFVGNSQTPLMEFWKRNVVLKSTDVVL